MKSLNRTNLVAGLFLSAIGVFFLVSGLQYDFGSVARMGPGFFPVTLSAIAILIGILVAFSSPEEKQEDTEVADVAIPWRSILAVVLSMTAFALVAPRFGLVPAVLLTILVASPADWQFRPMTAVMLAVGVSIASWLIFVKALGIPLSAFTF